MGSVWRSCLVLLVAVPAVPVEVQEQSVSWDQGFNRYGNPPPLTAIFPGSSPEGRGRSCCKERQPATGSREHASGRGVHLGSSAVLPGTAQGSTSKSAQPQASTAPDRSKLNLRDRKCHKAGSGTGFVENRGQMKDMGGNPVPFVFFRAGGKGMNIWITEKGITFQTLKIIKQEEEEQEREQVQIYWERIDMELVGATIRREHILKEGESLWHYNYFYPHCPDGIYGVKEYSKITIKEIYPGVDWVLYTKGEGELKSEFVVHRGADYRRIRLLYRSRSPVRLNENGALVMPTEYGEIVEDRPVIYTRNREIDASFRIVGVREIAAAGERGYEVEVGFEVDTALLEADGEMVIDPTLRWATFYGGSSEDGATSIATDSRDSIYITGYTASSTDFPRQDPGGGAHFQGVFGGAPFDAIILKFDSAGRLRWATFYGGSNEDRGLSIAVDGNDNVFVTGQTSSSDFPVYDPGTGAYVQVKGGWGFDAFILKFNKNGQRLWATCYGGTQNGQDDAGLSIAVDGSGNVFVTGYTECSDFPTLQPAGAYSQSFNLGLNTTYRDAFILKFDNNGVRQWATFYGGSTHEFGYSIAVDGSGNVYVTGTTNSTNFPTTPHQGNPAAYYQSARGGSWDAFILKFGNNGNRIWATYYGGSLEDRGHSIAADGSGNVFVVGYTTSSNFPTQPYQGNPSAYYDGTPNNADAFILKFDNSGNRLWATYFGGSSGEQFSVTDELSNDYLAIDGCGNVYVAFETPSSDVPTQNSCDAQYFDNSYFSGSISDIFLCLFSNTGEYLWGTYIGGDGQDFREALAVGKNNDLFMTGEWTQVTSSGTYPLANPGGGAYYDDIFNGVHDIYILKFCTPNCICPGGCGVLPLELLRLEGKCKDSQVELKWRREPEDGTGDGYFVIERSVDGRTFEVRGTVQGHIHHFTDSSWGGGIIYYRVKEIGTDGKVRLSNVVTVRCGASVGWDIYLDVKEGYIIIEGAEVSGSSVILYDATGRTVFSTHAHSDRVEIDISNLSDGVYIAEIISSPGRVQRKRIAISRDRSILLKQGE